MSSFAAMARPLATLVLLVTLGACREPAGDDVLVAAYDLGRDYRGEEARPLVAAYLRDHPDDAGGHFVLGLAYLHCREPYLSMAVGEFEMARYCLHRTGRTGVLGQFMAPDEFEAETHRETAISYLRWTHFAMEQSVPAHMIRPKLELAFDEVQRGLALDPDSQLLKEMEETLSQLLEPQPNRRAPRHERQVPPASNEITV